MSVFCPLNFRVILNSLVLALACYNSTARSLANPEVCLAQNANLFSQYKATLGRPKIGSNLIRPQEAMQDHRTTNGRPQFCAVAWVWTSPSMCPLQGHRHWKCEERDAKGMLHTDSDHGDVPFRLSVSWHGSLYYEWACASQDNQGLCQCLALLRRLALDVFSM